MKAVCTLCLLIFLYASARSQSCIIPQSLTEKQKEMVKGEWHGHYELKGVKTTFVVSIDFSTSYPVLISNAPLDGDAADDEYRFCGAGAFHFKKTIGNEYYEFDGVPEENAMQGTLVVSTKTGKTSGKFYLRK